MIKDNSNEKMNDVCIFGAGEWGILAKDIFKKKCNIRFFLDNDKTLWGHEIDGIKICSPDYLKDNECYVVVANKNHADEMVKQLYTKYDIKKVTIFSINIYGEYLHEKEGVERIDDCILVRFKGGLGNQMFIYAIYAYYLSKGKDVIADLSSYIDPRERLFVLDKVFPRITVKEYTGNKEGLNIGYREQQNVFSEQVFDEEVLNVKKGIVDGYFQTCRYVELVDDYIKSSFIFNKTSEDFTRFVESFENKNTISIHVRRGDYQNHKYLRGMASGQYYSDAIDYIKERVSSPIFVFFSDDIGWVKANIEIENAVYIEKNMFTSYEDWYDMYFMSRCKHNIISNSSFSWWGAWLNNYDKKIVIAPKKWMNSEKGVMTDICPISWIRL